MPNKNGDSDAEFEGRDLAPAEIRRLRRIMRDWDKYEWAWRLLGRVVAWGVFVTGAIWAARQDILKAVRSWLGLS